MSGKVIYEPPPRHRCEPWGHHEPITEERIAKSGKDLGGFPMAMLGQQIWHDDSHEYREGTVLECEECGRRWTLGPIAQYANRIRLMHSEEDWVPEPKWRWRLRTRHQQDRSRSSLHR